MNKYLNKLNVGMFICDKCDEEEGLITDIRGIKDTLYLNENNKSSFLLLCDFNFIEYEIPKEGGMISFRFFVRTLGGSPSYEMPLLVSEMGLKKDNEGVMTHRFPVSINIEDFEFPRTGTYAIEIYKVLGKVDTVKEEKNHDLYRETENFVSAISIDVKKE